MTLVLYQEGNKDKLLKFLAPNEEHILLNIWYDPTPPGVKRYEDLLNNTNLLLVDKAVLEFCQSWYDDKKEMEFVAPLLKKYLAQPAKVLAVINAFRPDRIIFPSSDHFLRGLVKSVCAYYGIKYKMVNVGDPIVFPITHMPGGFMPEQGKLNDQISEEFEDGGRYRGRKNILWFADSQTMLDLSAVCQSRELQPIIAMRNNFVDPEILGVFPMVQLPSRPDDESIRKGMDLFGDLVKIPGWVDGLKLLGVCLNEDFLWALHNIATTHMARYFEIQKWIIELHSRWNLKGILVGQDQFYDERAIVMEAKKLGIPTFVAQHGWYGDWYPYVTPVVSDYALAWGTKAKNNLEGSLGASRSVDAGTARLRDIKTKMKLVDKNAVKQSLGIPTNKCVVLFTLTPFVSSYAHSSPYDTNEMLKRVLCDFKDQTDLVLLVRYHPYSYAFEPDDNRDRVFNEFKGQFTFRDPGIHLHESLAIADLIVSHESTTIVEAMYCGKPVVELSVPGKVRSLKFDGSTIELNPTHLSPIDAVDNVWEACHDILLEPNKCNGILTYTEHNRIEFLKQVVSDESGSGVCKLMENVL